jgi:hypothetical protein
MITTNYSCHRMCMAATFGVAMPGVKSRAVILAAER